MFVGLGTECETFQVPEELNLFLSVPPENKMSLKVSYLGRYEVCRVDPLTVAEWQTLSPIVSTHSLTFDLLPTFPQSCSADTQN